jgi:alpha-D-ribose 1-methylphosphonate 5-triphosphate synthase subunit PhnG
MTQPFSPDQLAHSHSLNILTHAPAHEVKALADELLPALEAAGSLEVAHNRTGLVMLPYRDTVQGTLFHLGEVLVAEAEVRQHDLIGYGVVVGRDLGQSLAVALLDLAWQSGVQTERLNRFLEQQHTLQLEAQAILQRKVEATRVNMETF